MREYLVLLKFHSMQMVLFLASLNTVLHLFDGVPGWFVALVNICGVIATLYARNTKQPAVVAELKNVREAAALK